MTLDIPTAQGPLRCVEVDRKEWGTIQGIALWEWGWKTGREISLWQQWSPSHF